MKWSAHPKIFLELALIKLVNIQFDTNPKASGTEPSVEVEKLIGKIHELEKSLQEIRSSGVQTGTKEAAEPVRQRRVQKAVAGIKGVYSESEGSAKRG